MAWGDLLDSLVMALRKEEIYQLNGGYLNAHSLCKYLRDCHKDFYKEFQLKVFCWSFDIYRGKIEEALVDMKCFIPKMMKLFNKEVIKSKEFINDNVIEGQPGFPEGQPLVKDNIYNCPNTGLKAEICTVHSAKGETHLATLYVETFYQKKYESEHLIDCFCSDDPNLSKQKDKDVHKKESIKVAYVALSRSANLLCFAIHKDRFNKMKDRINDWEIVDLTNQ
jgi:hypothetical protein